MSGHIPEIECPACDGWGVHPALSTYCTACNGEGWRAMNGDELADAAEKQAENADFRADCARDDQMLRQWEDRS